MNSVRFKEMKNIYIFNGYFLNMLVSVKKCAISNTYSLLYKGLI